MTCEFWTGIAGVVVGALLSIGGMYFQHYLSTRKQNNLDAVRQRLLKEMLENPNHEWRALTTLSRVIGADADTTKRLLLDIGARGSEGENDVWALISRKPLP